MGTINALYWHTIQPTHPTPGDCYIDTGSGNGMIWDGFNWVQFSGFASPHPPFTPPTQEQLEKYPALKKSWEEFLVIKKILGV